MQHFEDIPGLHAYLKQMKVLPEDAELLESQEFERRLEEVTRPRVRVFLALAEDDAQTGAVEIELSDRVLWEMEGLQAAAARAIGTLDELQATWHGAAVELPRWRYAHGRLWFEGRVDERVVRTHALEVEALKRQLEAGHEDMDVLLVAPDTEQLRSWLERAGVVEYLNLSLHPL